MDKNKFFYKISRLAKDALISEVSATPKPGLVDRENSGAHTDMDINTFIKSAEVLENYFYRFAEYGFESANMSEADSLAEARGIGIDAEKAMYGATNGVNTHKGIIFSVGLICIAAGRLFAKGENINIENICMTVSKTVSGICEKDYSPEKLGKKAESLMTNGERLYKKYGIKGTRGEAESGFLTVRTVSFPYLKRCMESGMTKNEAMVRTLIYMMSVVEDTNVISRGGREMSEYVKQRSATLFDADMKAIREFDQELTEKNLSPGGCADLLAVTWFVYNLEQNFKKK